MSVSVFESTSQFFYLLTNLFYSSIAFGYAGVCVCVGGGGV